jgi:hypothetical protein
MAKGFEYRIDGGSAVDMGNVLTFPVTGLSSGTEYDFEVRKRDNAGNVSAWSSIVSATTDAGFTPASETGLWMWLKSSSLIASDNDPITTWEDSGSGDHDATNVGGGVRPTYKTNIVNGLPVLRFDGTEEEMTLEDMSALTEGEMFIVMANGDDPPTVGGGGVIKMGSDASGSLVPFSDGTIYCSFGTTARKTTVNHTESLATFGIYSAYSASGDWANYWNGLQLFSTGTNTVGFPAVPKIGVSATYFRGDIAEVVIYDHKLSAGVRTDVIDYLKDRYGIV